MAKKIATLVSKTPAKKIGKIAFAENLLTGGGPKLMTKQEVVAILLKRFPGTKKTTAKNTVAWVASVGLPRKGLKLNVAVATK